MSNLIYNYDMATSQLFLSYTFVLYLIFIVLIVLGTTDKPNFDIELLKKYDRRFDKMEGEIHELRELNTMVDTKLDIIIDKLND